jgi:hypothetical protein
MEKVQFEFGKKSLQIQLKHGEEHGKRESIVTHALAKAAFFQLLTDRYTKMVSSDLDNDREMKQVSRLPKSLSIFS